MSTRASDLLLTLLLLALFCTPMVNHAADSSNQACDRNCLKSFIDKYLEAMIAHDPGVLPAADNLKFTEDTAQMQLGEGLWKNISGLTDYRMDIVDVRNDTAITLTMVEENNMRVMFALRLRIANMRITEAETMVVRNREEGMIFKPEALEKISAAMAVAPDAKALNTREDMIKIAALYPAGLAAGSFVNVDVPFTSDTYRFENGQLMAGPGCTFMPGCEDIKMQRIPTLTGITQKVAAVDEELGIVLLRMNFGPGATFDGKNTLNVWEAFKVYGGRIHAVEAFMEVFPIGSPSGWD